MFAYLEFCQKGRPAYFRIRGSAVEASQNLRKRINRASRESGYSEALLGTVDKDRVSLSGMRRLPFWKQSPVLFRGRFEEDEQGALLVGIFCLPQRSLLDQAFDTLLLMGFLSPLLAFGGVSLLSVLLSVALVLLWVVPWYLQCGNIEEGVADLKSRIQNALEASPESVSAPPSSQPTLVVSPPFSPRPSKSS